MTIRQRMTRHMKRGARTLGVTLRSYMRSNAWCSPDAADWLRRKQGKPSEDRVMPAREMTGSREMIESEAMKERKRLYHEKMRNSA